MFEDLPSSQSLMGVHMKHLGHEVLEGSTGLIIKGYCNRRGRGGTAQEHERRS